MKWKLRDFIMSTRRRVDEMDDSYITDSEIIEYINAGIYDLASELALEETTILEGKGQTSFTLPENLDELKYVFVLGKSVENTTIDKKNEAGLKYYLFGNKIFFTQPVDDPELFYHKLPRILANNDDETDVPEKFQHLITLYSYARCLQKDQEMGLAMAVLDEYRALKYEMSVEIKNKQSRSGREFVDTSYWGFLGGDEEYGF